MNAGVLLWAWLGNGRFGDGCASFFVDSNKYPFSWLVGEGTQVGTVVGELTPRVG